MKHIGKMERRFLLFSLLTLLSCSGQIDGELEVSTEEHVMGFRTSSLSLPCRFNDTDIYAVQWNRHSTSKTEVVVQFLNGERINKYPLKYNITDDYSMVFFSVEIEDEGKYSCVVVSNRDGDGKGYTYVSVIALADPIHPTVRNCTEKEAGECHYTVGNDVTSSFPLTCQVSFVYPEVELEWYSARDELLSAGDQIVSEPNEDGLFNVTRDVQVTIPEIGQEFICKASGDAVNGTSSLRVSVVGAPVENEGNGSGGLSGGIIFVIIFFVVILPATAGAIIFFIWYRQRGQGPVPIPPDPEKSEFEILLDKIKGYTPGSFSPLEHREDQEFPSKTRLAVFGVTHAGKSSLVRSLAYAVNGEFPEVEVSQSLSTGGITIDSKAYKLTESISVVDNRGLRDLDTKLVPDIMKLIRGESEKLLGDAIACPILVFDPRQPIRALETFLPAFVGAIRDEYAAHPPVVFTHKNDVTQKIPVVSAQATGMGALDQRVFFIENFTDELAEEEMIPRRLEFLKYLEKFLKFADENMAHKSDKKARGDDANNVQPLIEETKPEKPSSTKTKGFSRFFGRNKNTEYTYA